MGSVNITLATGGLGGTLQTNDGVAGLVVTGYPEVGGYSTGTCLLISGLVQLATAGISLDGNPVLYRAVKQFYDEAGDGALLYVLGVADTLSISDICDKTNAAGAIKLLNYAQGKIRLLACMTDDPALEPDTDDGVNEDLPLARTNLKALAQDFFAKHQPFRAVLGATSYTGVAADLADMASEDNPRVAMLLGDSERDSGLACIGLLLGRLAAIPVQRKISRVANGPLLITQAWIGDVRAEDPAALAGAIAGKRYITLMQYANTTGFYFTGDPTATSTADDYGMIARGRVVDKAHVLAYLTFLQVVDDEIKINADGTLDAGFIASLEQRMVNQITNTMTAKGEISSVRCVINPNQNVLSTNTLNVVLRIVPVGYATDIEISLGFTNPSLGA